MSALRRSDLEAILLFVGEAHDVEGEELYPLDLLARLQQLVRCDAITYQELNPWLRCSYVMKGLGPDTDDDPNTYWRFAPCPTLDYRERTGDLAAVRTSDLISRRRYLELPIYREYFRPAGLDHVLDLGLPSLRPQLRSLVLFRRVGAPDFSERDRAVLEALRPHLYGLEAQTELRRRLTEASGDRAGAAGEGAYAALTPREREIAELLGEGKTNAEIAATLWVAPSTVKKHLEHIYAKIGVRRRAAVVAARYTADV